MKIGIIRKEVRDEMMKVLHLISGGDSGGAKTHVIQLLKELKQIIDIELVCFIQVDPFYSEVVQNKIPIQVMKQNHRADMSVIRKLQKKIQNEGFDIVHCHGARANFVGALLKRHIHIPIITTIHSDYLKDFERDMYTKWLYTKLNIKALKKMEYYIAVSNDFKKMLINRNFPSERVFTVYNGIDFNETSQYVHKTDFLNKYGIQYSDSDMYIGIIGRLDKVKGHEIFIRAAHEIISQHNNVKFLIAGDGPERETLEKLTEQLGIQKHICFLGFVDDITSFLNAIDINILTSLSESFPYAILEGARMQKPSISSAVGGIPDLIKDGENGYLFEVGNYKQLAQKVESLINDPVKRKELGRALYTEAERHYSSKALAQAHIKIYGDIMKNVQMKKKMILDIPVHHITMENAVKRVFQFLEEDKNHIVYTPNPEIIIEAQSNLELKQALHNADLVIPDGIGVVIASHFYSDPLPERVAGYDLVQNIFDLMAEKKKTVYFLGGKPGIVEKAKENMTAKYPGLQVVGYQHGYFSDSEEKKIVEDIRKKSPDLLLVGLGAPRQEVWIHRLHSELCAKVTIGVGGSFDVMSGMVKRAPIAFQKLGLEWFYRLITQPSRAKRMTRLPVFLIYALKERLARKGVSL